VIKTLCHLAILVSVLELARIPVVPEPAYGHPLIAENVVIDKASEDIGFQAFIPQGLAFLTRNEQWAGVKGNTKGWRNDSPALLPDWRPDFEVFKAWDLLVNPPEFRFHIAVFDYRGGVSCVLNMHLPARKYAAFSLRQGLYFSRYHGEPSALLEFYLFQLAFNYGILFEHDIPLEIRHEHQGNRQKDDCFVGHRGVICVQPFVHLEKDNNKGNEHGNAYGYACIAFSLAFALLCLHTISRPDWYESPRVPLATLWFVLFGLALWAGLDEPVVMRHRPPPAIGGPEGGCDE
jgi:hypothetical protein